MTDSERAAGAATAKVSRAERSRGGTPAERLVLRVLAKLHREQPLSAGFRADAVVARVLAEADRPGPAPSHRGGRPLRLEAAAVHEVLDSLSARGSVDRSGRRVALQGVSPELDPETRRRADEVLAALRAAGMHPPPARALARDAGLPERALDFLRERGELIAVTEDIDFPPEAVTAAERAYRALASAEGGVRAAQFRDALGTGRRHAAALLDYFDSIGISRREGGRHVAVSGADGPGSASSSSAEAFDEHDTRGVP